ncbi:Mitochondrial export translocase Oxa1 [Aspergillus sp. HF37]|nr:Mitochondrial export translocase Oxa1 [Aspergillus sp. HF37]
MLGGSRLKGPGSLPFVARRQLASSPGLSRSISSFSPRISPRSQSAAGNVAWRRSLVSGIRFNSTSTGASAAATQPTGDNATSAAPDAAPDAPQPESSDLSDISDVDIASIPEKIGYLKDLGLDYGWGPAAFMEYIIEHLHLWAGLPWWMSVVGTGLLIRLGLLKLMMGASDNAARMHNIKPLMQGPQDRVLAHTKKGDQIGSAKARQEMIEIRKQHGVANWKMFAPLIQAPLGYGVFRTVYGMSSLPVPGLANESVLWLNDLTVGDPYFVLPVASSFLLYYSLKKGGESGTSELSGTGMWKGLIRGLPAISFLFMQSMPSALQLYFVATGLFGATQALVVNNNTFRRWANMAIVDRSVPQSDLGRMLRMIDEASPEDLQKAKKAAEAKAQAESQKNVSFIDTTVNNAKNIVPSAKEYMEKTSKEATDKLSEFSGSAPAKKADGSPADPPRLSDSDRRAADDYEKRRREEEEFIREERNQSRRQRRGGRG